MTQTKRRRANWVLLVLGTLIVGSFLQAFLPACDTIIASGVCDPAWVYLATGAVAIAAVAVEIVLASRPSGRPCPACNTPVPTGATRCDICGHDFATSARSTPHATAPPTREG